MSGVSFKLHLGDCLDVLRGMPDNSVDAVVTDPPWLGPAFSAAAEQLEPLPMAYFGGEVPA